MPSITFSNPQALWLLGAILPLTVVYFFQVRRKRIETSTLFLFRHLPQDTRSGSRLERFLSSKAYWWQVLCIILATLSWANPLLDSQRRLVRVALVIDSSSSMQLSAARLGDEIKASLAQIYGDKYNLEYHIFSDALEQGQIISGTALPELEQKLAPFLKYERLYRRNNQIWGIVKNRIGTGGDIFYVSDHFDEQLPGDINQLNYGQARDNVGLCNPRMQAGEQFNSWEASLINYAGKPVELGWQLFDESGTRPLGQKQYTKLQANALSSIAGRVPTDVQRLQLRIDSQDLAIDNTLYLQCAKERNLGIYSNNSANAGKLQQVLLGTLQAGSVQPDPQLAELHISSFAPGSKPALPPAEGDKKRFSIACLEGDKNAGLLQGNIETGNSPLVEELYWDGLIVPEQSCPLPDESYSCILSQNARPLISFSSKHSQLLLHFDPARSNFLRMQSGIITLYRFATLARQYSRGASAQNFDCNQNLGLLANTADNSQLSYTQNQPGGQPQVSQSPAKQLFSLSAPSMPGFFRLDLDAQPYLAGSANFNDSIEADTGKLDSRQHLGSVRAESLQGEQNFNWRIWLLALLGSLLCLARELHKTLRPKAPGATKASNNNAPVLPAGF